MRIPALRAIFLGLLLLVGWKDQRTPPSDSSPKLKTVGVASVKQKPLSTTTGWPDWLTTNTPAWACIRFHESTNGLLSTNQYQFEGSIWRSITGLPSAPGSYPVATQSRAALALYLYDVQTWGLGFHAWSTRFVCGLADE